MALVPGLIVSLVTALICGGVIFGGRTLILRLMEGSAGTERQEILGKIDVVLKECSTLAGEVGKFVSKAQVEMLSRQVTEAHKNLDQEKAALSAIEERLDSAQTDVEQKEAVQQEIKSSKEDDEKKLETLLGQYEAIKQESQELEKKLAESLKNLDSILEEVELSDDQKDVFKELQNSLQQASASLRDLVMEHEMVNQRIENLRTQHADLEDEYTKLVEQQLGE